MKKTFITTSIIAGLAVLIALTAAPIPVGAQLVQYYGGYNARPYWNKLSNLSVVQGETVNATVTAVDENGDALTYAILEAPQGSTFSNATRTFTFTPNYSQLGSFPVVISATDGKTQPVIGTFYVNVSTNFGHYTYGGGDAYGYYNQAPYFSTTNSYYIASTGSNLSFYVTAIDPEGKQVRYSVTNLPAGASFNSETRQFSWTPVTGQRGSYTVTFLATDGGATSIPLSISIVVDGGVSGNYNSNNVYYPNNTNVAYNPSTYYPTYSNVGNYNANYYAGSNCSINVGISKTAIAGQRYTQTLSSCDTAGRPMTYRLVVGPDGAAVIGNILTWDVSANAVNKEYPFTVSASNGIASATVDFKVTVTGGTPVVTTIANPVKNVVRYINAPATTVSNTNVASYYPNQYSYTNGQVVNVTAGRVVPPTNYAYYGATAYGAIAAMPATAVDITTFNISVRVSADRQMIVSWDTNKPTKAEVVFGYSSQSRGADLDRTILNYDFTTGEVPGYTTRHEANLGKLDLNRTYYLRVISRADNQTSISREIVFIPMTTQEGQIIINQSEGAASAVGTLSNFVVSGGFLFFLLLIVIGLIIYLIVISRRPTVASHGSNVRSSHGETALNMHHENGNGHGHENGNGHNGNNGYHSDFLAEQNGHQNGGNGTHH
jgi:hypothetical protein